MKLKNKKTGEIIDIYKGTITLHYNQGRKTIHFKRLEDLEEWEDYVEPKGYWYIDCAAPYSVDFCEFNEDTEDDKQIGNYFESREKAEKAVEKLKAWKRLKDKGFEFFNNKIIGEYGNVSYTLTYPVTNVEEKDLDLLFGDEE